MYFFKTFDQTSSGWAGELWIPGLTPARVTITALGTRLETAISPLDAACKGLTFKPDAIEMGDTAMTQENVKATVEVWLEYWVYDYAELVAGVGVHTDGDRWQYPTHRANPAAKPEKVVEFW